MGVHRNPLAAARKYRTGRKRHQGKSEKKKNLKKRKIEAREIKRDCFTANALDDEGEDLKVETPEEYQKPHEEKWKLEDLMKREDFRGFYNVSEKTREEFEKNLGGDTIEERILSDDKINPLRKRRGKNSERFGLLISRWVNVYRRRKK